MILSRLTYIQTGLSLISFVVAAGSVDTNDVEMMLMQKQAPLPSNPTREVKRPVRNALNRVMERIRPAEQQPEEIEYLQESSMPNSSSNVYDTQEIAAEDRTRPFAFQEKRRIWNRLLKDLQNVPDIDREYNVWRSEINDGDTPFWQALPSRGAINWRILTDPASLDHLYNAIMTGIEYLPRPWLQPRGFVLDLEHDNIKPWPRLVQPEYAFFQRKYEEHLQNAKDLLHERSRIVWEHGGGLDQINIVTYDSEDEQDPDYELKEYLKSITADVTAQMVAEATKAYDILHILQLTFRNIRVEQNQATTLHSNRRHNLPDNLFYSDKRETLFNPGTPSSSLLDD